MLGPGEPTIFDSRQRRFHLTSLISALRIRTEGISKRFVTVSRIKLQSIGLVRSQLKL